MDQEHKVINESEFKRLLDFYKDATNPCKIDYKKMYEGLIKEYQALESEAGRKISELKQKLKNSVNDYEFSLVSEELSLESTLSDINELTYKDTLDIDKIESEDFKKAIELYKDGWRTVNKFTKCDYEDCDGYTLGEETVLLYRKISE